MRRRKPTTWAKAASYLDRDKARCLQMYFYETEGIPARLSPVAGRWRVSVPAKVSPRIVRSVLRRFSLQWEAAGGL